MTEDDGKQEYDITVQSEIDPLAFVDEHYNSSTMFKCESFSEDDRNQLRDWLLCHGSDETEVDSLFPPSSSFSSPSSSKANEEIGLGTCMDLVARFTCELVNNYDMDGAMAVLHTLHGVRIISLI